MKKNQSQKNRQDRAWFVNRYNFIDVSFLQCVEITKPGCSRCQTGKHKKQQSHSAYVLYSGHCSCYKYHQPGKQKHHDRPHSCCHIRIRFLNSTLCKNWCDSCKKRRSHRIQNPHINPPLVIFPITEQSGQVRFKLPESLNLWGTCYALRARCSLLQQTYSSCIWSHPRGAFLCNRNITE